MTQVSPWVSSAAAKEATAAEGPAQSSDRRAPKRINIAVSPDTVAAIENVMNQEGVGLTEAVRRLLTYGDFVYQTIKGTPDKELMIREGDKLTGVVLLR